MFYDAKANFHRRSESELVSGVIMKDMSYLSRRRGHMTQRKGVDMLATRICPVRKLSPLKKIRHIPPSFVRITHHNAP